MHQNDNRPLAEERWNTYITFIYLKKIETNQVLKILKFSFVLVFNIITHLANLKPTLNCTILVLVLLMKLHFYLSWPISVLWYSNWNAYKKVSEIPEGCLFKYFWINELAYRSYKREELRLKTALCATQSCRVKLVLCANTLI